jgi:hypothetical protein
MPGIGGIVFGGGFCCPERLAVAVHVSATASNDIAARIRAEFL